jgi:ribosomal protein S18 acetylase RimI-like enzyme
MRIEPARTEDAIPVMEIITQCMAHMRTQGIYQWDEIYPSLQVVEADARSQSLFVIRQQGACVAAVCLNTVQPEQYREIQWQCATGHALVIHRLCVHPQWQRHGFGRQLMDFTEAFARQHRFSSIRLDTYTGNPLALALYERLGYQRRGQVYFPRRELPFDCFEKLLPEN